MVKKAIDELTTASNGIVSKMYQSANPNGATDAGNAGNDTNNNNNNNGEDPVVDVD